MNTNEPGLYGIQLSKAYQQRMVLKGVDVCVRPGEIVGLLGPNGAGKTTCFSILVGFMQADQGRVILNGVDISNKPLYQRARMGVGYLPQDTSIFRGLTVEQNILVALELRKNSHRFDQLEHLLDEFQLTSIRHSTSSVLSGGERRRLEIARALAMEPTLLLLDEPLAGIDPIAVGEIRYIIESLKKRGIGILMTDHNVRETLNLVDRAYILANGHILKEGTPTELVQDESVREIYLGSNFKL